MAFASARRRVDELEAELAASRAELARARGDAELYAGLARRNQALLERQISLVVDLEQRERDPDRLAELFRLDHLANRIRRNMESLVVLAGDQNPRRWGRPVALADVGRAASAEVGDYPRVTVMVDEGLFVNGRAVADLAHLLAELVENALAFSPAESQVVVRSHRSANGNGSCTLTIADGGIGLTEQRATELNAVLAAPASVAPGRNNHLGLRVAGRLAAHHGVTVTLAADPEGGAVATVGLPAALLVGDEVPEVVDLHPGLARRTPTAPVAPLLAPAAPAMSAALGDESDVAAPLRAVPSAVIEQPTGVTR